MRCLVGQTDVLLDAVSLLLIKIDNLRYLRNEKWNFGLKGHIYKNIVDMQDARMR